MVGQLLAVEQAVPFCGPGEEEVDAGAQGELALMVDVIL